MKILEEANRVTQRLHGATLYGSRMVVKIARDNQGRGWKRNTTCRSKSTEYKKTGFGMDDEAIVQKMLSRGECDGHSLQRLQHPYQWKKEEKRCEKSDESVSDLKSNSKQKRHEAVEDDRSCFGTEVEVLNVMCAERDHIKCLNQEKEICGDKIIEAELIGGVSKDKKLTNLHVNGDSVGIQRVIFVEKVSQKITMVDGFDNGPIEVSSNRSGPEGKIGMGFKDKDEEFKGSWANMLDKTFNSGVCGGVLLMQDGDVWVMFAGSSHGRKSIPIGVTTVILALEIY
ncbi:hypothetical protein V6N13_009832 [Hibiscus sabdariffa]